MAWAIVVCVLALSGIGVFGPPAWAGLGQPPASSPSGVLGDIVQTLQTGTTGQVQQTTLLTVTGVTVQEFSQGGPVFALTWSGPVLPDLSQLLADYFPAYSAAGAARSTDLYRAPLGAGGSGLVAHTAGHMGAYWGSAYAPALVPAGVDVTTLGVQP